MNTVDILTLEEILEARKVFISTGYQFDLPTLSQYHQSRDYRGTGSGSNESDRKKYILNPATNQPLHFMDQNHLKAVAQKQNCSFKDLKLTDMQSETLNTLKRFNLTESLLMEVSSFDFEHEADFLEALTYLMTKSQPPKTAKSAVATLRGLHYSQAQCIAAGITKSDCIDLTPEEIDVFFRLHGKGLTIEYLQTFKKQFSEKLGSFASAEEMDGYKFHLQALFFLVAQANHTLGQAMSTLKEVKSSSVAWAISQGFDHPQTVSAAMMHIFFKLQANDPNIQINDLNVHLKSSPVLGKADVFSEAHGSILLNLVTKENKTVKEAMNELKEMDYRQVRGVVSGLTKEESTVLGEWEGATLIHLRQHGLTAEQLRHASWQTPNQLGNSFFIHLTALMYLVKKKNKSIEESLEQLKTLDEFDAWCIPLELNYSEFDSLDAVEKNCLISINNEHIVSAIRKKIMYLVIREQKQGIGLSYPLNSLTEYLTINKSLRLSIQHLHTLQTAHATDWNEKLGIVSPEDSTEMTGKVFYLRLLEKIFTEFPQKTTEEAIAELAGLVWYRAAAIVIGFKKEEALQMNQTQFETFFELDTQHNQPLPPDTFLRVKWENGFDLNHKNALIFLITQQNKSTTEAMTELENLTSEQAQKITQGETRAKVLEVAAGLNRINF